jgi:hypothetical protein
MRGVSLVTITLWLAATAEAFVPLPSTTSSSSSNNENRHQSSIIKRPTTIAVSTSPSNEALERVKNQLNKINQNAAAREGGGNDFDSIYREYAMLPANTLKMELKRLKLPQKGRKPDLAKRLAEYEMQLRTGKASASENSKTADSSVKPWEDVQQGDDDDAASVKKTISSFCGISLSKAGSEALTRASFQQASPIQHRSIPAIVSGESVILHAETGSGKTLAYLLPITEQLWLEHNNKAYTDEQGYFIIMTPTRELAAQVAGVASVLAPPGFVRLVSHPTNLCNDGQKDRGEEDLGGRQASQTRDNPRLIVGSAKAIMQSLYGDGKMPASPTTKPEAMNLLRNVRYVVLDEVDRLLNIKKVRGPPSKRNTHEKPAAVVSSAVARMTLGRAQVVAASATVGRPLKRELTRVLGLATQDCPRVIRGGKDDSDDDDEDDDMQQPGVHLGRAVTIPETVDNYIVTVDEESTGKILTSAMLAIKQLNKKRKQKMLLVLTRGCGINTQNAVGALKHFRCDPEPVSLLDALQADGTDSLIEKHREVSGAGGIGEAYFQKNKQQNIDEEDDDSEGYLLVTGEDTVRGLHLDGLETVLVVGRAQGPDEYTHIAGRTGRAGKPGKVVNVMNTGDARKVNTWDKLLDVEFTNIDVAELANL